MNQVTLIGRLGADPEIRTTQDGRKLANMRVATTERWKDKNGERREKTEWQRRILVSAFRPFKARLLIRAQKRKRPPLGSR